MFDCDARTIHTNDINTRNRWLECSVLEQHPYTTQTFVPLNAEGAGVLCIVVVADAQADSAQPDVASCGAYALRAGQAVTYAANQWHAPMMALGHKTRFLVTNAENGTEDDCVEHYLKTPIRISLRGLDDAAVARL